MTDRVDVNFELGMLMNWEITKCPFFFERGEVFGVNRPLDEDDPRDDFPWLRPRG